MEQSVFFLFAQTLIGSIWYLIEPYHGDEKKEANESSVENDSSK